MLTQLGVYWAHLFHIPMAIINSINCIIANFIWAGGNSQNKFHLTKLSHIACPRKMGGWGIINLKLFGASLLMKSLWRAIFGPSTWCKVIKQKYMKDHNFLYWFHRNSIDITSRLGI